ncbi:stretch-activated Ca2+-permeable channel component-domain-containing protein [Aspergillus crustosus]
MALSRLGSFKFHMRRQIVRLQYQSGATASLIVLLFVLALTSPAFATLDDVSHHGNIFVRHDAPSEFCSLNLFNGLLMNNVEDATGQARSLGLISRARDTAYPLRNNRLETREILMGEIQYCSFSTDPTANNSVKNASANDSNSTSKRAATAVYLSLTICSKPILNESISDNVRELPQLAVYVSTSNSFRDPGPHQNNTDQTVYHTIEGYMSATVSTESNVYIGIVAPEGGDFSGSYSYQMAASTDDFFHNVDEQASIMSLADSGSDTALLTIIIPADRLPTEEQLSSWKNDSGVYTIFVNNGNNVAVSGLSRSYCALERHSQTAKEHNVHESLSTHKRNDNGLQEQFYITGLNRSSTYVGVFAMGDSTGFKNGVVGGGGKVWKPETFSTKADGNCDVIYDLEFCSDVAYAVPSNPSMNLTELRTKYDNYAADLYKSFNYSLQQIQCNTSNETIFSMAVNCDDCASAYKSWLCAVTIPRCDDYSGTTNSSAVMIRNAAQPFPNGTAITNKTLLGNPVTNRSRHHGLIDIEIKPGPYKEVLPSVDVCHRLLRNCPMTLGFACPKGKWLTQSYNTSAGSSLLLPWPATMVPFLATLLWSF